MSIQTILERVDQGCINDMLRKTVCLSLFNGGPDWPLFNIFLLKVSVLGSCVDIDAKSRDDCH